MLQDRYHACDRKQHNHSQPPKHIILKVSCITVIVIAVIVVIIISMVIIISVIRTSCMIITLMTT